MAGGRNRTHLCFDVMHLFEAREEVDANTSTTVQVQAPPSVLM